MQQNENKSRLAIIVGFVSFVVAIVSCFATIYQGYLMREHNRLSVSPRLKLIPYLSYKNQNGIYLTNSGLGPAIITKITVRTDGKIYDNFDTNIWPNVITALNLDSSCFMNAYPSPGAIIKNGESAPFISLSAAYEISSVNIMDDMNKNLDFLKKLNDDPKFIVPSLEDSLSKKAEHLNKFVMCKANAAKLINHQDLKIEIEYESMYGTPNTEIYASKKDPNLIPLESIQ